MCQKKRKTAAVISSFPPIGGRQTQIPYYDDVVLKQEVLELKANVAHGPI